MIPSEPHKGLWGKQISDKYSYLIDELTKLYKG